MDIVKVIDKKLNDFGEVKLRLVGIGIGVLGFVNFVNGLIEVVVNLGWEKFFIKDILEVEIFFFVVVDNDVNIVVIGEMWKGVGDGVKDLLCVMFGIGVGGGVIVNGEIV